MSFLPRQSKTLAANGAEAQIAAQHHMTSENWLGQTTQSICLLSGYRRTNVRATIGRATSAIA
jgi:hypothetical protein